MNTVTKCIVAGLAGITIGMAVPAKAQNMPTLKQVMTDLTPSEGLEIAATRCAGLFSVVSGWMNNTAVAGNHNSANAAQMAKTYEALVNNMMTLAFIVAKKNAPGYSGDKIMELVGERAVQMGNAYSAASQAHYNATRMTMTPLMKDDMEVCQYIARGGKAGG